RSDAKLDLIQKLAERKLDEEDAGLWYRLLDWLLPLSDELARELAGKLRQLAQEKAMPFVSYLEREALKAGLREGPEKEARQAGGGGGHKARLPRRGRLPPPPGGPHLRPRPPPPGARVRGRGQLGRRTASPPALTPRPSSARASLEHHLRLAQVRRRQPLAEL